MFPRITEKESLKILYESSMDGKRVDTKSLARDFRSRFNGFQVCRIYRTIYVRREIS